MLPFNFMLPPEGLFGTGFKRQMHPTEVYSGRSKTHKSNIRTIKKTQRRRAFYKSLRRQT